MSTIADQSVVRAQYADSTKLGARQAIWRLRPGPSLVDTVLGLADLGGAETVADIGCGNGLFLSALRQRGHTGRLLAIDLSPAMAAGCRRFADGIIADAQALPLRTGSVDVALSVHMLFHVPDLVRAVAELRRLVRPGGAALVTTNGTGHSGELTAILSEAARQVTGVAVETGWSTSRFAPATARALLAGVFEAVRLLDVGGPVPVRDASVVSAAIASLPPESVGLEAGPTWSAVLAVAGEIVAEHFARHAEMTVTSGAVVLVCR